MTVLVFLDYFTPAYKAGGPIRIFEALAESAGPAREVSIVTQNTDWGDPAPLQVPENAWVPFADAHVLYLSKRNRSLSRIRNIAADSNADAIHLNSLFSRVWTLKVLFLNRMGKIKPRIFLSPHGELAESALRIKPLRKSVFLLVAKLFGLFRGIRWIATSEKEAVEIKTHIGADAEITLIPPPLPATLTHAAEEKHPGRLRLVFLARLSAMKNLPHLLEVLPSVRGKIDFDIFGPIDPQYTVEWQQTLTRLMAISPDVKVTYHGPIPSTQTREAMAKYDLFVQPSLSENFGYSIVEALAVGTPALISDRTPWNEINSARIGAALSLERADQWIEFMQSFVDMDHAEWLKWSTRAQDWVRAKDASGEALFNAYRD